MSNHTVPINMDRVKFSYHTIAVKICLIDSAVNFAAIPHNKQACGNTIKEQLRFNRKKPPVDRPSINCHPLP